MLVPVSSELLRQLHTHTLCVALPPELKQPVAGRGDGLGSVTCASVSEGCVLVRPVVMV